MFHYIWIRRAVVDASFVFTVESWKKSLATQKRFILSFTSRLAKITTFHITSRLIYFPFEWGGAAAIKGPKHKTWEGITRVCMLLWKPNVSHVFLNLRWSTIEDILCVRHPWGAVSISRAAPRMAVFSVWSQRCVQGHWLEIHRACF